jgi:hypothetical protein
VRIIEEQILNSMIQQGAFAVLFVWMLITTQKKNEQREEQYQKVIEKTNKSLKNKQKHLVLCRRIYQMLNKKSWGMVM